MEVKTIEKFIRKQNVRLSEDEIVEQLTESIRRSDLGETKPAKDVSMSMRKKYARL